MDQEEEPNGLWGDSRRPTRAGEAKNIDPKIGTEKSRQKTWGWEEKWTKLENRSGRKNGPKNAIEKTKTREWRISWKANHMKDGTTQHQERDSQRGRCRKDSEPRGGSRNHEARQQKTLPSRWETEKKPRHQTCIMCIMHNVHNAYYA